MNGEVLRRLHRYYWVEQASSRFVSFTPIDSFHTHWIGPGEGDDREVKYYDYRPAYTKNS